MAQGQTEKRTCQAPGIPSPGVMLVPAWRSDLYWMKQSSWRFLKGRIEGGNNLQRTGMLESSHTGLCSMDFDWICSSQKTPEKRWKSVKQQHGRLTERQAFPWYIGGTTDLAWRATIDEFHFTWHRQILNLLIWKFSCSLRSLGSRDAVLNITTLIHYCSAKGNSHKWVGDAGVTG